MPAVVPSVCGPGRAAAAVGWPLCRRSLQVERQVIVGVAIVVEAALIGGGPGPVPVVDRRVRRENAS